MAYEYDMSHDSGNFTAASDAPAVFGMPRVIEGITIHWWGDPNQNPQFASIRDYLCRAGGNTSAHFVATGTNRQVACIVAPKDVAWHSGSAWGNARTIGIELDPRARDEDYDVAAELVADIRSAYGDVPIYWHSYFTSTTCPGVWNPERLDALSYTKYSAAEWGQGGDINPKAPVPPVIPPVTPPVETKILFKVLVNGKQVGAYSSDVNAYRGYVEHQGTSIMYGVKDVTAELITKFTASSPTTEDPSGNPLPDTGKPVVDKDDYEETKRRVGVLEDLVNKIINFFKGLK
jgi:hypothetical protein